MSKTTVAGSAATSTTTSRQGNRMRDSHSCEKNHGMTEITAVNESANYHMRCCCYNTGATAHTLVLHCGHDNDGVMHHILHFEFKLRCNTESFILNTIHTKFASNIAAHNPRSLQIWCYAPSWHSGHNGCSSLASSVWLWSAASPPSLGCLTHLGTAAGSTARPSHLPCSSSGRHKELVHIIPAGTRAECEPLVR